MPPLHSLLKRQIKRHYGELAACPKKLEAFLDAVNEAYWQADDDRAMLERALELSSQELLTANSEMRAMFQAFPDLYFRLDATGLILDAKTGSDVDLHVPPAQLVGKRIQDVPDKDVAKKFSDAVASVRQTKSLVSIEYSLKLGNELKHFEARLLPLLENQILVTVRNITGARHLQEQLRQSQKMEAIGQLAGGVAHDFNNLLTVISGHCELLRQMKPDALSPESVEEIQKAAERASQLTRRLLAFSRKQVLQTKVLDLNDIVGGMERMVRRLIGENVELRTTLQKPLHKIIADPGQMEQVIMNLVVNARDAMPRGGRVLIETANVRLDQGTAHGTRELEPGDYVMLAVSDTGIGMTDSVKTHLFEPFFTTKGPGKGTGLGLATCYGIVRQSGGDIRVHSEPDRGTTFHIYIPRTLQETAEAAAPVESTAPCKGTESLLLIEDEVSVRRMTASALRNCGYMVHEVADGVEALQFISTPGGPRFDLIISDVIMPRMGGKELVERIRLKHPDIKVLFISGYTDDALGDLSALGPGVAFLGKPFSPKKLAQCVRELLDEPVALSDANWSEAGAASPVASDARD